MEVKSTFGYSPSCSRKSIGSVPSSIERTITLIAAICVTGKNNDHVCPGCAFRNLFDARADAKSAGGLNETSLLIPVVPLVPMTRAICAGHVAERISPIPSAGPVPANAAAISPTKSGIAHAGLTRRISRCDFMSIAAVGYR